MIAEETASLIARAQKGDKAASEQLVVENNGLIWSIVRRFFGRGVEGDDLYQLACLGFLKAVQGFDLSYGTSFSTYAVPKITGEIRRFLRDDGAVKVSRGAKERARQIRNARCALEQRLGREPTIGEIAAETGIAAEDVASAELATGQAESLQQTAGTDGPALESALGDSGQEERMIERMSLSDALSALPERERMLLFLRYYHSLTQERTARLLGISQVQVSRLERKAVDTLKSILAAPDV